MTDANAKAQKLETEIARLQERQKMNEARLMAGEGLFEKLSTSINDLVNEVTKSRVERQSLHNALNERMGQYEKRMDNFEDKFRSHMDNEERLQLWIFRSLVVGVLGLFFYIVQSMIVV